MQQFQDCFFADQVNPYQHLEQYEEEVWLRDMMASLSKQFINTVSNISPPIVETIAPSINTQEALEFEPFDTDAVTRMTPSDFAEQYSASQTGTIQAHNVSAQNTDSNGLAESTIRPQEPVPAGTTKRTRGSGVSFNTTDYIIKHCLKKMLGEEFREEVQPICQAHQLAYSSFSSFWKQILKRYAPNRHIGLTRFIKFIEDSYPAAMVCRIFFSSYLMREYPRYIAVGSMHNKQEYLRCATKLMYISCPPKMGTKHIVQAREQ